MAPIQERGTSKLSATPAVKGRVRISRHRLLMAAGVVVAAAALIVLGLKAWLIVKYDQLSDIPADDRHECNRIAGIAQGEDIAVDWAKQRAFVSGTGHQGSIGRGLYRIDLAHGMVLTNVTPALLPVVLRPHGLSLHTGADGQQRLFVVNHAPNAHSVLIFEVAAQGALVFSSEVTDAALYNPNDIAAVGPRQFYVTNSTRADSNVLFQTWRSRMRVLLGWDASGDIAFFDGTKFRRVVDGLVLANGINVSPDGTRVYVAETFAQRVTSFARDLKTNELRFLTQTPVRGVPDNIDVSPDGQLFVASLPHAVDAVAYLLDPGARRPPTQIVKLSPRGDAFSVEQVWVDDGKRITAVTVGAAYGKTGDAYHLLLGTMADEHLLACAPR